jgi:glycosyltransferase involved in cell wall biosynthesis
MFLHAINVHQGGGRTLLNALLKALPDSLKALPDSVEAHVSLDSRMQLPEGMPESIRIKRVTPSVIERLKAERWLADIVCSGDVVLCFGNLPPLFKLRGRVVVFVQNRYLIDGVCLDDLKLRDKVRLRIERLWLSARIGNVDEFIVQTPEMKRLLTAHTQGNKSASIKVVPFVAEPNGYARSLAQHVMLKTENCDFLYVATGGAHKNHRRLIEAWCLLAKEGVFPSLRLTLDESQNQDLCLDIEEMRQEYGLKIWNEGALSHSEVLSLYNSIDALIYPSTFESFGLPLIEARQAGLRVLAPEMDYVRDVLDPEQTFDPQSPVSIARAVKRFLGVAEYPLPLIDAREFINHLIGKLE